MIARSYQPFQAITNYLGTSNFLSFNDSNFILAWSTHPFGGYYKQEYIKKGESLERFNDMMLIDFTEDNRSIKDIVKTQIAKLVERKKMDPVCNYELKQNIRTNEYILDFLMSESVNNIVTTLEWNVYHYKICSDKSGKKGVVLLGISHRSYDNNINDFMQSFSGYRHKVLEKFSMYPIPYIQLR